ALADEETTVHRVRRGRDVSEAARRIQPEVIVLDMQIGNMGGIATALSLEQEFEEGTTPWASILVLLDRPADVWLARRGGGGRWVVQSLAALPPRRARAALLAGAEYKDPSGLAV